MTDPTIRALLEQALNVLTGFEQNYGSLWYSTSEPEQIDSVCSAIRAELAKPTRCDLCGYQHGHQIGCANNPVDIALSEQAAITKAEGSAA